MLDIGNPTMAWPPDLEPIGEGDHEKESFEAWWARHRDRLEHLHPRICEQWIHRHWSYSPYKFLTLESLSWRLEMWPATDLIDKVYMLGDLDPEFDFEAFNRNARWGGHPTSNV